LSVFRQAVTTVHVPRWYRNIHFTPWLKEGNHYSIEYLNGIPVSYTRYKLVKLIPAALYTIAEVLDQHPHFPSEFTLSRFWRNANSDFVHGSIVTRERLGFIPRKGWELPYQEDNQIGVTQTERLDILARDPAEYTGALATSWERMYQDFRG